MADTQGSDDGRVVIKKYANRRLYNTASSSYVTLEHLSDMVKQGVDFVVYDAKTNEDITRTVLTQIIFEEESREGQNLLPIQFLRQLIGFYGNSMQAFLPSYLELSLATFAEQQERMRAQFASIGQGSGLGSGLGGAYEDQIRQNLAMFDRAMKMFSPFAYTRPAEEPPAAKPAPAPEPAGDETLRKVAHVIGSHARRPLDITARYGGEEFVGLWYHLSEEHLRAIMERIRADIAALNLPHVTSEAGDRVSISIGVAYLSPQPHQGLEDALRLADVALYLAKEQGRNRVVCKRPGDDTASAG